MQKYQIIESLGKCPQDNSILNLAKQKQAEKYFMMKKIALFNSNQSQQFILNQAKILKQLNHPHILKYYDILLDQDDLIEVLQFCQYVLLDGSISSYLQKKKARNQNISEKLIISWVMQILMALEYLNQKHIVHRLLTADNIYLNHQGDLKIGSFGKAKQLENTLQKAQTIVGQPCNLSPQMVQGGQYDSKTDIWSLGCLIYQLATFQPPFKYGNLLKLYDSIVQQSPPQLPIKYSKHLAPLYRKIMKKNPSARPSASQLLQEQVFSQLMKQYLKKKKIDSVDLKKIQPKPLVVMKKLNMQRKVNKIQLEPIISTSRVSVKSPLSQQKQVVVSPIISPSVKEKKSSRSKQKPKKNQTIEQKTAEKSNGMKKKIQSPQTARQKQIENNQFIESRQQTKLNNSPPLPKKTQKTNQKQKSTQTKQSKLPKNQVSKSKQQQKIKSQQPPIKQQNQQQQQVNQQQQLQKNQQKKVQIQQLQRQYIALLYKIKLQQLQQKYSPNMSKIFEKTEDLEKTFKCLLNQREEV